MINLKNPEAQKLMEQKTIYIDGIEVNLWQGHTKDSIITQQNWNKIASYVELNKNATGVSGNIVFTGTMQICRDEAAAYAIDLGFCVKSGVSRKTDYIILGSSNVSPCKISKAIEFNQAGCEIQFIDEISFLELVLQNEDILNIGHVSQTKNQELDNKECKEIVKRTKKERIPCQQETIKLEGMSFVVSGSFSSFTRDELKSLIEKNGGKNLSGVSSKTNYLVAGDKIGPSKLAKAEKLNVTIISEDEFKQLINQ